MSEKPTQIPCLKTLKQFLLSLFVALLTISLPVAESLQAQQNDEQADSGLAKTGAKEGAEEAALASPGLERDFHSERQTIRWSDFRQKVAAVLPDYSLEQLTQELAELGVDARYIGGDVNLSASASYSVTGFNSTNPTVDSETHTINWRPMVSKKFLHTGTTLSLGLDHTLRMQSISSGSFTNSSTLAPTLTVTQDLLQNFFGLLDRLSMANARRQLEIAKEQRRNNERKLQQSYDQLYLKWILQWRTHQVLVEQLEKSVESLRNAQRQRNLNYIDNGTYQQIYNSHLVYRKTLLNNEQQLLAFDQKFARFLGEGHYQPDIQILEPLLEQAKADFGELHFEDSWTWAISQKTLDKARILYKYSKYNRLPSLTLSTSVGLKTNATYAESEQPEYTDLKPNYSMSLSLAWPVLMRKANNDIQKSKNQLEQLEVTLNKQRQNFEIDIAQQRASHQFLLENYALQQQTAKAKSAIYVSNQVKYRQARASIRNLLDAEIQNLAAELDLLNTENELVNQLLNYSYETRDGELLSRE